MILGKKLVTLNTYIKIIILSISLTKNIFDYNINNYVEENACLDDKEIL